jgi:tetratricopeptide (TPR) repeat protein
MKHAFLALCLSIFAFSASAQTVKEAVDAYNSGATFLGIKNYPAAIKSFEKAIEIANTVGEEANEVKLNSQTAIVGARKQQATELYSKKNYEEALKVMELARNNAKEFGDTKNEKSINNALPRLYYSMGAEDLEAGRHQEAISNYNKSLEINPNQSNTLLAKGVAYQKMDSVNLALESYDKTMDVAMRTNNPAGASEARKAATNLLLAKGQNAKDANDYNAALGYFTNASKYSENNPDIYLQIAVAANSVKKYSEAATAGEKALTLEKRANVQALIHYQLGFAYEGAGNNIKACENYRQILVGDNNKENANNGLKRLKCN